MPQLITNALKRWVLTCKETMEPNYFSLREIHFAFFKHREHKADRAVLTGPRDSTQPSSGIFHVVAYLLKARTVEAEKQPSLGNDLTLQ
jgi:hypothetical protein